MTRIFCLTAALLALTSCALAQRGTLRGERVIITNQDPSVYPPNDFQIRNAALSSRVQIGINAFDRAVSSYFNENDNLTIELDTTESVAMFRVLADSPNTDKITGGISTGGTALDTGYFQILGEDRASGLDAYTAINGGDIDTNTILVRTTNAGPGYIQWDDATGTGGLVSLFGYNGGSAASYSLYWPAASYATSSCSGTCAITIDDSTGQMSFAAFSGGGGGGSPGGVTDEIQLNDGAGGFDTVTGFKHDGESLVVPRSATSPSTEGGQITLQGDTGAAVDYNIDVNNGALRIFTNDASDRTLSIFNAGAGDLNITLSGDMLPGVDGQYALGSAGTSDKRWALGAFDDVRTEDLLFQRQGQASHDFGWSNTSASVLELQNSGGGMIWQVDGINGWIESAYHLIPNPATKTLGNSASRWASLWASGGDLNGPLTLRDTSNNLATALRGISSSRSAMQNTGLSTTLMEWRADTTEVASAQLIPVVASTTTLGSTSARWGNGYFEDATIYSELLPDANGGANIGSTSLRFAQGYFTGTVAAAALTATSATLGVSNSVTGSIDLGLSGTVGLATISTANITGSVDLTINAQGVLPNQNGLQHLGYSSKRWMKVWTGDLDQSGNATLTVGTGNFYGKTVGGASTAISCAGVGDGWQGVTTDNYLVWCRGGTRYRAAGASY